MLAKSKQIRELKPGLFLVPSQSHGGSYVVDAQARTCTCPDYATTGQPCKHVWAVEIRMGRVEVPEGTTLVTQTKKPTYQQNWTAYNAAQTTEKERFEILLRDLVKGVVQPAPKKTGRPALQLADVVYAAVTKVYSTVSGRRASTDIRECEQKGLLTRAPHYNSVFRYMEDANLTPILRGLVEQSAMPLQAVETDFAIDGTGFSTCNYVRWFDERGMEKKTQAWVKAHAMIGVKTHVVTAAEVTHGNQHDSPLLPMLTERTAKNFTMREVSADKGYLSFSNYEAVEKVGATPYIAFKENSIAGDGPAIWKKLFHLYSFQRDEFLAHYHKRSNSETVFSAVKRKFGPSLRSRLETAQFNEVYCKLIAHNIVMVAHSIHELGIAPQFWAQKTTEGRVA
ncbi:transposase [Polyangium fumosum]|nr:transposase [Polyangium fumosum]